MTDRSERLHPEGAPGIQDQFLRQMLGDAGFEKLQVEADKARQFEDDARRTVSDRYETVTSLWTVLHLLAMILALTFIAIAPALVIAAWRALT